MEYTIRAIVDHRVRYSVLRMTIVDDEPQVRVALSQIINIIGRPGEFYVQEQAANGRIALEKLRERQVDIVLSDISMPVMTGLGLADHLMREYPHIVTIFLSGYGDFSACAKILSVSGI